MFYIERIESIVLAVKLRVKFTEEKKREKKQ